MRPHRALSAREGVRYGTGGGQACRSDWRGGVRAFIGGARQRPQWRSGRGRLCSSGRARWRRQVPPNGNRPPPGDTTRRRAP